MVGMRQVPLHARSTSTAQIILGPSCANVTVVPSGDASMDDDREFFVTAWCLDPRFIPDEEVIFIPEPTSTLVVLFASVLRRLSMTSCPACATWCACAWLSFRIGTPGHLLRVTTDTAELRMTMTTPTISITIGVTPVSMMSAVARLGGPDRFAGATVERVPRP